MSAAKVEMELRTALLETGLVQPVRSSSKGGHVELLCRQVPGQERVWLMVVANLLLIEEQGGVTLHICRRYILKDKRMAYGWHLQIDSKNVKTLTEDVKKVCAELAEAKPTLEPTTASQKRYQSPYKTDAQVTRKLGIGERDAESGYMGRVNAQPKLDLNETLDVAPSSASLRMVKRSRNSKGVEEYEMEMPLPFQKKELNVPKHAGGKGATRLGGD